YRFTSVDQNTHTYPRYASYNPSRSRSRSLVIPSGFPNSASTETICSREVGGVASFLSVSTMRDACGDMTTRYLSSPSVSKNKRRRFSSLNEYPITSQNCFSRRKSANIESNSKNGRFEVDLFRVGKTMAPPIMLSHR